MPSLDELQRSLVARHTDHCRAATVHAALQAELDHVGSTITEIEELGGKAKDATEAMAAERDALLATASQAQELAVAAAHDLRIAQMSVKHHTSVVLLSERLAEHSQKNSGDYEAAMRETEQYLHRQHARRCREDAARARKAVMAALRSAASQPDLRPKVRMRTVPGGRQVWETPEVLPSWRRTSTNSRCFGELVKLDGPPSPTPPRRPYPLPMRAGASKQPFIRYGQPFPATGMPTFEKRHPPFPFFKPAVPSRYGTSPTPTPPQPLPMSESTKRDRYHVAALRSSPTATPPPAPALARLSVSFGTRGTVSVPASPVKKLPRVLPELPRGGSAPDLLRAPLQ
jgi:hypothetical protein